MRKEDRAREATGHPRIGRKTPRAPSVAQLLELSGHLFKNLVYNVFDSIHPPNVP
jgi:hypothetical protein